MSTCLSAWVAREEVTLVIFPSFLFSKLLNLFSCLCLTLVNLNPPTFSTKPWHSLSLCVDRIDANCDLHSCVCLPMLSRILFIALTLAWSNFFSAFLLFSWPFLFLKLILAWYWLELNLYEYILGWRFCGFCNRMPLAKVFSQSVNKCSASNQYSCSIIWCRFLILLVESCSKLVISVTEHLVEVVDNFQLLL